MALLQRLMPVLHSSCRSVRRGGLQLRARSGGAGGGRRAFATSMLLRHEPLIPPKPGQELHCHFVLKDGTKRSFEVAEGDNLLDIAQENDLEMEGACGGSCACSTCHVVVDHDYYDRMEESTDDEEDMLDLAFGLTETSRLGCQIHMSKRIDGITVTLPKMTRNLQKSDFDA